MKYSLNAKIIGKVYLSLIKNDVPNKKELMKEYKKTVLRAKDIGSDNMLIGSYYLACLFIAMNRTNNLGAEANYKILESNIKNAKGLIRKFLGSGDDYCSEKKMIKRREWSKKTYERKYENDWVVDIIEDDPNCTFGFDYHECGDCKLCKDEGVPELAKYLCRLDFLLVEQMGGITLERTMTLANGDPKCDFRFTKH